MYDREPGAFGPSSATLSIDADAKLTLMTGAADTGTGSYTVLQQIVAEALQVPLDAVSVVQGNTDTASWEVGAGGSRLTHMAGQAALAAVQRFKEELSPLAAQHMESPPDQVEYQSNGFVNTNGQRLELTTLMTELAGRTELPLNYTGEYMAPDGVDVTSYCAQCSGSRS